MTDGRIPIEDCRRDLATLQRLPTMLLSLPAAAHERYDMHLGLDRMQQLGYVTWQFATGVVGITPLGERARDRARDDPALIYPPLLRPV